MRIAIIGSGIAGLTASWLLTQSGHEVHIYEKASQLGMDAHGYDLDIDMINQLARGEETNENGHTEGKKRYVWMYHYECLQNHIIGRMWEGWGANGKGWDGIGWVVM